MQEIIKNPGIALDSVEWLNELKQIEKAVNGLDTKNCLRWHTVIPDTIMDEFFRHEFHNLKYVSLGIPAVPLSKLPLFQRLRPIQKKQVRELIYKKMKKKAEVEWYELWTRVAQFFAAAYSPSYHIRLKNKLDQIRQNKKDKEGKKLLDYNTIDATTKIGVIIKQYLKEQNDKQTIGDNTPVKILRKAIRSEMPLGTARFKQSRTVLGISLIGSSSRSGFSNIDQTR
jgi:hypothetical protein